jgi:predicted dehydrogenase
MLRRAFLSSLASAPLLPHLPAQRATLRVGVIGHTTRGNYGHGLDTLWLQEPRTTIVAVSDPDPAGLAAAQKRLSAPEAHSDHRALLEKARPHIVAICPRHADQHHQMLKDAIEAGVRGIYIEKPYVRTPREADEISQLAKTHGTRIAVAHRNRYHPALLKTAALLKEGTFGTPLEIRARGKEDKRGGALDLWVLGSHVLNLAAFFAGTPTTCTASVRLEGRPVTQADIREGDEGLGPLAGDEVRARFETPSGIPIYFDSKKDQGNKAAGFGLQLVCSEAVIDLRTDAEPMIHVLPGNPFRPTPTPRAWTPLTSGGVGVPEPLPNIKALIAGHQLPASNLIECMETGAEPTCGPTEAAATVEMIASIFESHRQNSATVRLPLSHRDNPLSRL